MYKGIIVVLLIISLLPVSHPATPHSNIDVGNFTFSYCCRYGSSYVKEIFHRSLVYTLHKFYNNTGFTNVYFNDQDIVYINETTYNDFYIRKYLIVDHLSKILSFRSIIMVIDDDESNNVSYLFRFNLIRPCNIPSIYLVFKLSNDKISDLDSFIEKILIPVMNELLKLDVLNPKCSFTRFANLDPRYIDDKEKLLLIARFLLLESTLLNSNSNSTNIIYDFIYNGVNDSELAFIAAKISIKLGFNPIIINYKYQDTKYWMTLVNSNIYLSSIDRLFTLQCLNGDSGRSKYRIISGTSNNLWHWTLIITGRIRNVNYYKISHNKLIAIKDDVCNFNEENYSWLLIESLIDIDKALIYYCDQESIENIGAGCLLVNYAFYKFQKQYMFQPIELDLNEIEEYIISKTHNSFIGKNEFLSMIYPWYFSKMKSNELISTNSKTRTEKENKSSNNLEVLISIPAYIYIPLSIGFLSIIYFIMLFYYIKYRKKYKFTKSLRRSILAEEKEASEDILSKYLSKTLRIGIREQIVGIFSYVLDILSKRIYRNPWETHREYGERIKRSVGGTIYKLYMKTSKLYEKAKFSTNLVTKKDLEEAWDIYNKIDNEIKNVNNAEKT